MKLNLTVEGQILASLPINAPSVNNDYHLKAYRRLLTLRYRQKLALLHKEHDFQIEYAEEKKGKRKTLQVSL